MSMTEWAKKEIEIACNRENPNRKDGEWDYGCACYESALKAYESLMEDDHSGFSFSMTARILKRLLDSYPLTPIEDVPDVWNLVSKSNGQSKYQCKRMPSFFKTVSNSTGDVSYSDCERIICVDQSGITFTNGFVSREVGKKYPIEMPYYPNGRYYVYETDFAQDAAPGTFDTMAIEKVKLPDGTIDSLNWYYKETSDGFVRISCYQEYLKEVHHDEN